MFDPGSRYAPLETSVLPVARRDGRTREVRYVRRRFVPPPEAGATLVEHRVVDGDRLDLLAARYLGDALAFWAVADANAALHPADLTAVPGAFVRIAQPGLGPAF